MLSCGVKGGTSGLVDNVLPKLVWSEERAGRDRGEDISKGPVVGNRGEPMAEQSDVVRERCRLGLEEGQPR